LLHAIPPIVALISLLALWASNRTAAGELEKLTAIHRSLAKDAYPQRSARAREFELPDDVGGAEDSREVVEELAVVELPPLVVPGTMDELGHALAAVIWKEIEFDRIHGGHYAEPEPGTPEFEVVAEGVQSIMSSITPITAGMQVLSESLRDPVESGRCLGVVVSDLIGLDAADTEVIAERLAELRKQHAEGVDPASLSQAFFEESRDIIGDSQAELLRENLGADFPSMPLSSLAF
jgi:hypothetical protein